MKCYHHNDADGRCAAAIVWKYFEKNYEYQPEFIEVDYKDEIKIDEIEEDELIYVVDFSFKPEVMNKIIEKTTNVIWIDHHKTAIEYEYKKELNGTRDTKYAGCELTWQYLFPEITMPRAVELIGDYDRWAFKLDPETSPFHEGLKLHATHPRCAIWPLLFETMETVDRVIDDGETCIKYRDNYCEEMRKSNGYSVSFGGHLCYVLNVYGFGSPAFGEIFDRPDVPVCISYIYDGCNYTVGLYSKTVDVSKIAKKHGGGGHTGAAGFVCRELPFAFAVHV